MLYGNNPTKTTCMFKIAFLMSFEKSFTITFNTKKLNTFKFTFIYFSEKMR